MTTVTNANAVKHRLDCIELLIQDAPQEEKEELVNQVYRLHDSLRVCELGDESMGR